MIEIRVTGESLQECLKQLEMFKTEPVKVEEPVKKKKVEPAKVEEPVKEPEAPKTEEPVKEPEAEEPAKEPEKKLSPAKQRKLEEQRKIDEASKAGPVEARQACVEVKDKLGMDALKALLGKFLATKFREVPEDQMPALYWEAKHMLEVAGVAS